jgi:cytochrome c oxidase subunit I+III
VLITSVTDAGPLYRQKSASTSIWPFIAGIAVTIMFIASIFTPWAIPAGILLIAIPLTGWFWPRRPRAKEGPLGTGG